MNRQAVWKRIGSRSQTESNPSPRQVPRWWFFVVSLVVIFVILLFVARAIGGREAISIISIPGYYGGANFYVLGQGNIASMIGKSEDGADPRFCPREPFLILLNIDYRLIRTMDIVNGISRDLAGEIKGFSPTWSPDCTHIAFLGMKKDGPEVEVYLMDANGQNLQQLTDNQLKKVNTAWSPDGSSIAYEFRDGGLIGVGVVKVATKEEQRVLLGKGDLGTQLEWSPDGTKLAVVSYFPSLEEVTVVTASTLKVIWKMEAANTIAWSPDGQWLAFVSGDTPREVYVMPADGGTPTQVTHNNLVESELSWLPDGRLVFLALEYHPYEYGGDAKISNFQVDLISPDGSGLQVLERVDNNTMASSILRQYIEQGVKLVAKSLVDGAKKYSPSVGGTTP